ncbi:MAG: glycosyltransferase [Candidatus Magasanikbacteria bacterium CG10_big_fil_rev_8_21_14_0_10_36_32]|uniref:Glycosyltransferase n=1 Tax=Candidatus Magasanikbacteria bacterium CG10_big_fil_rev_8_21_14_0_10_36_32 TaxID=1974646 RepID=A0A2M6W5T8_9BACT|nr:MAG: glycosyltransferase [Candidatus Magasanikbacteria bacterium CG10_big_fil_rev_8_21_14_0_10_36_32]
MDKKKIEIVVPCYNEVQNAGELYLEIQKIINNFQNYDFGFLFIDNASTDGTDNLLKKIASEDKRVRVILNNRNFGPIRSPYYGLLQTIGDAVIIMSADFQDPPELIVDFIKKWEEGNKIVLGIKNKSKENKLMFILRRIYYFLIKMFSEVEQIGNFTGFCLYDKSFIDILRTLEEPYPYLRGLVGEFGLKRAEVFYVQPVRKHGQSHNNFYTLYDIAMNGFINHSKLPLRLASLIGFSCSFISLLVAVIYFVYKLFFWNEFQLGLAPIVIGIFFFSAVQLFFIGVVGEYVGAIYTQVKKRPLVIEKERINFD